MSTTCIDEDDTVSTLGTIDGGSVFEDCDLFNVIYVNAREDVVEESIVNRGICVLKVLHHAIKNNAGLRGGVKRIDTLNHHHSAHTGSAGAVDEAEIAA